MPNARSYRSDLKAQLVKVRAAQTVDAVLAACPQIPEVSCGDGFWEADYDGFREALFDAGWHTVEVREPYYWAMSEPEGLGIITYVEGDLYRGNTLRGAR